MKKISYSEDWGITNATNDFDYDAVDERMGLSKEQSGRNGNIYLPGNFDCSAFNDKQVEYLSEYLQWYRKDTIQEFLSFITKPLEDLSKKSERHQGAIRMRVLCRLILLHKLLNDIEVGYRDLSDKFGISSHVFYDERKRIIDDLSDIDKNISFIVCNNRKLK